MLLPMLASAIPVRAAQAEKSSAIVGEWMWGSTIADAGADGAEKIMKRCASNGITDVYLLVKGTGGQLGYLKTQYTDILTRKNRDVLQEAIDAAHKRGIRVHAWICVVQDETYKSKHKNAGMWHYIRERDNNFITPYDEGYREYIGTVAKELAQYDIDGIHLDYIRYNHNANGWSAKDFENLEAMGANIDRVKELVETTWGYHGKKADSNYIFSAYNNGDKDALIIAQYRRKNIKELAQYIISEARSVNPDLVFSAAMMPEGAYENAFSDLHYGQNYEDAADLYDYVCPMAYSTNYGKTDSWVVTLAKNTIDKGNKVVMGIQTYDNANSNRIMTEMENIRALMKNSKYGSGMLGTVFFRAGTFEYAKVTYDTENKIITVKLDNIGSSAYTQVQVDAKNGIKFTAAVVGSGVNAKTTITKASNGTYVKFASASLLQANKSGYLYLKYEGNLSPSKLPALVHVSRSSGEIRLYTATFDAESEKADLGDPKFPEPVVPETPSVPSNPTNPSTPSTPTTPETPSNPNTPSNPETPNTPSSPETPEEDSPSSTPSNPPSNFKPSQPSEPSDDKEEEKKPSSVVPIIVGAAAATAVAGAGAVLFLKKKRII